MPTPRERDYIEEIRRRINRMRAFFSEHPLPDTEDFVGWYRYLAGLKSIQGNANTDISFAATMMAKSYLSVRYSLPPFDATAKAQAAPGLDLDIDLADGRRLIAEIKTTVPLSTQDFGAQQKATFEKDFSKLAAAKADVKLLFLTERKTFQLMTRPKYRSKLTGVRIVLLPDGEEFAT